MKDEWFFFFFLIIFLFVCLFLRQHRLLIHDSLYILNYKCCEKLLCKLAVSSLGVYMTSRLSPRQAWLLLTSVSETRSLTHYLPCWSSIRYTTWTPPLWSSPSTKPSTRGSALAARGREAFLRGSKRNTSALCSTSPATTTRTCPFERATSCGFWRSPKSSGGTRRIRKAAWGWFLCRTWRSSGRRLPRQGPCAVEERAPWGIRMATTPNPLLFSVSQARMPSPHLYPTCKMGPCWPERFRKEFPMPMIRQLLL